MRNNTSEAAELRKVLQSISDLLLVRLRSLGDSILTLPLIDALHRWRPELKLSILVEAPFAPVFLHHPAIHETLVLPQNGDFGAKLQVLREVRQRRYNAILNLHGGSTSMIFALAGGARARIGQESHRGSRFYTCQIPSSGEIWNRQPIHTVEHQLSILRWLDIPFGDTASLLHVSETARLNVDRRLTAASIPEFILIQPTATLKSKQWPPANFAALGDRLNSEHGLPIVFTAAPGERGILEEIAAKSQKPHTGWSDLALEELFALIERCRLFIGCDSGPMHAAAALNKPVVVVWGSSNFHAWHPWKTRYEAVRSELPCIPCPGYTCQAFGEPRCILEIPVSRMEEACSRMLFSVKG